MPIAGGVVMKCQVLPEERKLTIEYAKNQTIVLQQAWFDETGLESINLDSLTVKDCRALPYPVPSSEFSEQGAGLLFEYYISAGNCFFFSAAVTNSGKTVRRLRLRQSLSEFPAADGFFSPTMRGFSDIKNMPKKTIAVRYRGAASFDSPEFLSIPMFSYLSVARDIGFTFCAHIEMPIAPFLGQVDQVNRQIALERQILELQPGETQVLRHYLVVHQGCWRSGLGWVRDKFARFFMLPDKNLVERTHGCFIYSNIANQELCRKFQQEGVKNLEIHFTHPFFGKYLPEEEAWISQIDDKWNAIKKTTDANAPAEDSSYQEIKKYLSSVMKINMSRQRINDFIKRLKNQGIQSFLYFMPTENWEFYAKREFPESVYTKPDGSVCTTWKDHLQVRAVPGSRWWHYLCRQLEGVLNMYPDVAGIFIDQSHCDRNDYCVCQITKQLAKIALDRGKLCYWNGPYLVELIEHAVGLLAESAPVNGELIKYLTIGDKVCCGLGFSEPQYQRNLINGLWPPAPSQLHMRKFRLADEDAHVMPLPDELEQLHKRYMYLYKLYPGKTWVLEPHALQTSVDIQANIFQRPDGDYLVPLMVPCHSWKNGKTLPQIEITVRASGLAGVKGVYWRTPDLGCEQYAVAWSLHDSEMKITLPWIGSAGLLWLAQKKQKAIKLPPSASPVTTTDADIGRVYSFSISMEGLIPTGNMDDISNGLKTTAPLPPVPQHKMLLNNKEVGLLCSVNSRNWHNTGIWDMFGQINFNEIARTLKTENELLILPDGEQDFFKVRNIIMTIILTDGRIIRSRPVNETFSSCPHELAEGIIGSPLRIKIQFSREQLQFLEE